MKMQIKEFAEFTGVSVRTLHYYDEKNLLRMQEILFYRELDFSLKSISDILSSSNYDKNKVLKEQKHLLTLRKERLERLILAIDDATKGENVMRAFDNSEFETYKQEAKEKWGSTDAYKEHAEKTKQYSKGKWNSLTEGMNDIFTIRY